MQQSRQLSPGVLLLRWNFRYNKGKRGEAVKHKTIHFDDNVMYGADTAVHEAAHQVRKQGGKAVDYVKDSRGNSKSRKYGKEGHQATDVVFFALRRKSLPAERETLPNHTARGREKGGTEESRTVSWYGFSSREEWCACFVSWCAKQCGYIESGVIPKFSLCWMVPHGLTPEGSFKMAVMFRLREKLYEISCFRNLSWKYT